MKEAAFVFAGRGCATRTRARPSSARVRACEKVAYDLTFITIGNGQIDHSNFFGLSNVELKTKDKEREIQALKPNTHPTAITKNVQG